MIEEDYVSFETAKLLKEKGFDEHCRSFWRRRDWMDETAFCYCGGPYDANNQFCHNSLLENYNDGVYLTDIAAPTLQMAMKWVQETFNIVIIPNYEYECDSTPWCYKIFKLGENGKPERVVVKGVSYDKDDNPTEHIVSYRDYERSYKDYATKEEACEAGIRYVLENLIEI